MEVKKHILHRKMDEAMGHLSFFLWKKVVGTYTNTSHQYVAQAASFAAGRIQDTAPLNGHFRVITMNHHVMQLKKW